MDEQINDTKKIPFKTMVNNAKKACKFTSKLSMFKSSSKAVNFIAGNVYNNNDAFFYSKDISKMTSLTEKDINQYLFASYIGLLVNCSINYLIYTTKPQGLLFKYGVVKREQQTAANFLMDLHNISTQSEVVLNGIVLCKNKKEFETLFKENQRLYDKRNDKSNKRLGSMFNHLYAFIMIRPAIFVLGSILCFNGKQTRLLREHLIGANCGFKGDDVMYGSDFTYKGNPALIGVDMDLTNIQQFIININSRKDRDIRNGLDPSKRRYTVVCHKHQKEYYEAIMPENVDYYIFDYKLVKLFVNGIFEEF